MSIDTRLPHQGVNNGMDPLKFFAAGGVSANEGLADALDIYHKADHPKDSGAHGAHGPHLRRNGQPGDMLEVRMIDFKFRVPYGVNNSDKEPACCRMCTRRLSENHPLRFAAPRCVVCARHRSPLVPFMGIMAVSRRHRSPTRGRPAFTAAIWISIA